MKDNQHKGNTAETDTSSGSKNPFFLPRHDLNGSGSEQRQKGDQKFFTPAPPAIHRKSTPLTQKSSHPLLQKIPSLQRSNKSSGIIMRSPLSDQARASWTANSNKAAIFDLLRANSPTTDADLVSCINSIFTAGSDDLWLAQTIMRDGPEPIWPLIDIQERQRRAMTNSWAPEPGNIAATLGSTPGHTVQAFYFRGTSDRRALIIGGVHGSEAGGPEVVNDLLTIMRGPNAPMPFFSVIIVPELFSANLHDTGRAQSDRRHSAGTVRSIAGGTAHDVNAGDPNRQLPAVGTAPVYDATLGCLIDTQSRCIEPENLVLLDLVNRFQPERVASVHGHGETDPARMLTEGGASVTTDPRPGHEAEDDTLALAMAREADRLGVRVPGNFLGTTNERTRYPNSTAPHEPGTTFGQWGSHDAPVQTGSTSVRPAMNIITVETFRNTTSTSGPASQRAARATELMNLAQVLRNFFLVDPSAVTTPPTTARSGSGTTTRPTTTPSSTPPTR